MADDELWSEFSLRPKSTELNRTDLHRRNDLPCQSSSVRPRFYNCQSRGLCCTRNRTHKGSIFTDTSAISTSTSWPPASCQRPLIIRGITSEFPIVVHSGCTVVGAMIWSLLTLDLSLVSDCTMSSCHFTGVYTLYLSISGY